MKGLKALVILGLVGFSLNTQALKLKIVKKNTSIAHETIDRAEIDSMSAEQNLKEEFASAQIDEDGFDTIKTVKPDRTAASRSIYKRQFKKVVIQDDFEEPKSKIKRINIKRVPQSDSITTGEAMKNIESTISSEFEDEIGDDELSDEEDYFSAGI